LYTGAEEEMAVPGDMSSAYSMTEPDRASSDATQAGIKMENTDTKVIINGRKLLRKLPIQPRDANLHPNKLFRA
jgi:hypothetical protein